MKTKKIFMSKNKMRNLFRFDNEIFSQSELNNYISSNKKLFKLKQTLIKLNNLDKNNYKHVIYGGSTSCCKLLCGLLTILGYENIYDENHKIKNKDSNYFAFLTFGNVYQKPLSKRTTQNIKKIFNSRPDNINGQKIKFIIIDHYYKEGLDLFDVKYMHIFSKIPTINEEKQIIGRTRRMCGHIGLPLGTKQYVYSYYETPVASNTFSNELTKICYYASVDYLDPLIGTISFDDNLIKLFFGEYFHTLKSNFDNREEDNIFMKYKNVTLGGGFENFRKKIKSNYPEIYNISHDGCNQTKFKLTPTQKFVKKYFTPTTDIKGLLCWHSTGSGKTCLGLGVASSFIKKGYTVIWVSRSSLLIDIRKNLVNCYGSDFLDQNLLTMGYRTFSNMLNKSNQLYSKLKKKGKEDLSKTLIIIDEAHKLFDDSLSSNEKPDIDILKDKIKNKTCRLLLMTATPFINEPMHLIKLLNLILYDKLPENKTEFTNSFLQSDGINFTIKGATEFINQIHKNISYLDLTKDLSKFAIQVRINI